MTDVVSSGGICQLETQLGLSFFAIPESCLARDYPVVETDGLS